MCLLENIRKQDLLLTLLYTILATFSHLTLMLYYSITTIFKCLDILSTIQLEGLIAKNSAPGDHKYYEKAQITFYKLHRRSDSFIQV